MQVSNRTEERITTVGERTFWTIYMTSILVSSYVGDTIILIASVKYRAFRLHKVIVTIIQHLAVCDLILSICWTPVVVSLIADRWILGDVIGFIRMNFSYYGFLVSWLLIATLSTLKLTILKFPLRAKTWDSRHGHMICTTIWALGIASPVQFFIIGWDDIFFDYRIYLTDYKFSAPIWEWYLPLCTVIMSVLPLLTVAITTIPTLMILNNARKVAKKSRGRVRWQGIITVVFTATFHSLSTFPSIIYMVGYLTVGWGDFDIQFKRCSMFVVILNVTSNFYIYSLTVRSFQDFIKKKFLNKLYMITPAPSDVMQETPLDERSTIVRRGSTMT